MDGRCRPNTLPWNKHGTWKCATQKRDSYWKSPFVSGSKSNIHGVSWISLEVLITSSNLNRFSGWILYCQLNLPTPIVPIVYGMNGVVQQVLYATYNQDTRIATILMVVSWPRDPGPTEGTKTLPIFLNRLNSWRPSTYPPPNIPLPQK